MKRKNGILMVAIPMLVLLAGATFHQYFYVRVQEELRQREDRISAGAKILAKQRMLIAERAIFEEHLVQLKEARKGENTKLVEGQTPSVAAATLQGAVKGMITSRGGSISSERVEKPEDAGEFKIITVTLDALFPDTRALGDTLYAIEAQTPYLVIREIDTRIRSFKEPRELSVKLKVSGLTGGVR